MDDGCQISFGAELVRKSIHLFALVIPIGYLFVPFPAAMFWVVLAIAVSITIDLARFYRRPLWLWLARVMAPIFRDHEIKGSLSGATYILVTAAVTIVLFPKPVTLAALTFVVVGDAVAALVGRRFGRHRLVGRKSLEGSAACFLSVALVSFLIPGLPTPAGLAGATTATLAEMFSNKIDDNLTVPLASGLVMLFIMHLMGMPEAVFFGAIGSP